MAGFGRICSIVGANTNYVNFMTSRNICRNVPLCTAAKERTIEKLGIPPMPKKPLNAFVKFMMSERSKVVEENPKLSATEIVKEIAQRWATCDPKEKAAIQKTVEVELLAYSKKMMMYEQSITPEQRSKLRELRSQKLSKTDKQKMKKALRGVTFSIHNFLPRTKEKNSRQSTLEYLEKYVRNYRKNHTSTADESL